MAKNSFEHIEDNELLQKFYNDGNTLWLGILLERYTMLLLGVSMKYLKDEEEAKDAVQQVFFKVISEMHKYKVEVFKSWLYMVTKNLCLMKIREKGARIAVEVSDKIAADDEANIKMERFEKEQTLLLVEDALNELNEEQKQCVTLFYLEKKTYQQVADGTGYNLLQVKSYIQNGKRNLKMIVETKMKKVNG